MDRRQFRTIAPLSPPVMKWLEIALVALVFFVVAAWPVPDVNEPHYLGKAKHYWQPSWGAGDFFLESRDAHLVFYWLFGWVTQFLSLTATAWVGRILAWSLLAWAWWRLSFALVPRPLVSVLTAALVALGIERLNLAGEWMIGGIEAKPLAYVLVLLGAEALVRGRWNRTWLLLGGASAIHVLVGGWSVVMTGIAWLTGREKRPRLVPMLPYLVGGLLLSLPGLVPALMFSRGVPADVVRQANMNYVYNRLPHHLALHTLPVEEMWTRYIRHGLLVAALALLCYAVPAGARHRRFRRFIWAAVGIAAVGLVFAYATRGLPEMAAGVLRYYWFRMTDVAVPIGVAITAARGLSLLSWQRPRLAVAGTAALVMVSGWYLGSIVLERHEDPRPRADRRMADYAAWLDVTDWVAEHIPPGSRFVTPRMAHTFTWRTGLPQVVSNKDIPQDAPSIVEWQERIDTIYRYVAEGETHTWDSLSEMGEARLETLGARYDADYVLTEHKRPLRLPLLYANGTYAVYRINGADDP
ncbi:MAG: DUF6798 domain-containing protein [Pirellulales bacterium]